MLPKHDTNKKETSVTIQCPNCELKMNLLKKPSDSPKEVLSSLIKNFALISLVESQKSKPELK